MTDKRSKNEQIKEDSRYLRGGLADGLRRAITGAIDEDDTQLIKFHGSYMQDDRDVRAGRGKKKLEKAFSFMLRLRIPAGVVTPRQWLALDQIAGDYANQTLRVTTRETIQYHGVIKSNLRRTMQAINAAALDTLAACGDVNRNVLAASNPFLSRAHGDAYALAKRISDDLLPRTGAYHEVWLDGDKVLDASGPAATDDVEPLYGRHYLPRKFKIVVAVPPSNDVDIFAHDLGYIASVDKAGAVTGYIVTVGGGMGMTHGELDTFPRAADVLGFCKPEDAVKLAEAVMTTQRDWGNREKRARARLKYTIEDRGLAAFKAEVERRMGVKLGAPRPFEFKRTTDPSGWVQSAGKDAATAWHLTLWVENGRVSDAGPVQLRTALREIATLLSSEPEGEGEGPRMILSANQNVIVANVSASAKSAIEAILQARGVTVAPRTELRRGAMACVGLPTCGLALAESERSMPGLVGTLETVLEGLGLAHDEIIIRMTGCPNGCARPYLAEIGLVGRGPGRYNLYLGAALDGTRLNKLYAADVDEGKIAGLLEPLFGRWARDRRPGEHFGDFCVRVGVVKPTLQGRDFHADVALAAE